MRNIVLGLLLLGLGGCSDFLEESSQDEVRPSNTDDLMQIMVGEAYPMDYYQFDYIDFITDDVQCNGSSGNETAVDLVEGKRLMFTWDDDMYEESTDERYNSWGKFYEKIMGCNVVLDYVDKVTGEQSTKDNMKGQALVLRAFYYLQLVNYYGLPYNYGDPTVNLGVPLKLKMDVTDEYMERNTVAEVYDQILTDLQEGVQLLEENPMDMSLYKISDLVGKSLLCRTYLYMEKWDSVLTYANEVLEKKPNLTSLASAPEDAMQYQGSSAWSIYDETESNEIIWKYSGNREYGWWPGGVADYKAPYSVSNELMDLYEFSTDASNHLDLRYYMYFYYNVRVDWTTFLMDIYPQYGFKGGKTAQYATRGIRTAEIYLNRAEANIHKFMETGDDNYRTQALEDLNKLRENRYDTRNTAYQEVEIMDADELYKFYQDERRRELCFEDHRWFDLRRYGMPEITHVYFVEEGQEEIVTLNPEDPRYVLPIPRMALERNPYLKQNER